MRQNPQQWVRLLEDILGMTENVVIQVALPHLRERMTPVL